MKIFKITIVRFIKWNNNSKNSNTSQLSQNKINQIIELLQKQDQYQQNMKIKFKIKFRGWPMKKKALLPVQINNKIAINNQRSKIKVFLLAKLQRVLKKANRQKKVLYLV